MGIRILTLCFTISFLCACNTIAYYENAKNKKSCFFTDDITGDDHAIEYLNQDGSGLPWLDFYTRLICEWGVKDKEIKYESIIYEIYNIKGELIEPF